MLDLQQLQLLRMKSKKRSVRNNGFSLINED